MREEIETPGDGRIRAFVTIAGNPVLSTPDGRRLGEALDSLDFMVAIDLYLNETTRHADVILPPTTALERDHYDLVFHSLAIRNTARFSPAVFAKPEGARHDWEIFRDLTARLEAPADAAGPAQAATRTPSPAGAEPDRSAGAPAPGRPTGVAPPTAQAPRGRGPRAAASDHARAAPDREPAGRPGATAGGRRPRPAPRAGSTTVPDDALVLIGRRHRQDNNSWFHNTTRLTRGKPRHQLLMHPDDLASRGIEDGALVTVSSRVGLACGSRWPRPTT